MVETTQLQSVLSALWQQLALNPANRALVIARIAATHAPDQLKSQIADQIRAGTPPGSERDQALTLLKVSPSVFAHIQPPPDTPTVRVDPELGRLCIALFLAAVFRIWVIARELTRQDTGSGQVQRAALRESLSTYGITITREHFNRLLRGGEGTFWNIRGDQIFIRSPRFVAAKIVLLAAAKSAELVATNLPGVRDVYLSPAGSHEAWEAMLYAGWMAHRENPTIARETLEMLFGRSADTLRRWEQKRLQDTLTVRENYAQCHVPENDWFDFIPEHCRSYLANVAWNGNFSQIVRVFWRMPNTYIVKGIRQHPRRGQAAQVRKIVNAQLDQPTSQRRSGLPRFKRYYDSAKQLRDHVKKHGGVRYLWRGESKYGRGIFEPNENGFAETKPNERASFQDEGRYFARLRQKREQAIA
ncbi:MAG: hypothetical protein ABI690_27390 [Chloroflexota bacterium]